MASSSKASIFRSVGAKIALLPLFGLISIFFLQGVDIYFRTNVKHIEVLKEDGAEIAKLTANLLLIESKFMESVDDMLLDQVAPLTKQIDDKLKRSRSHTRQDESQKLLDEIDKSVGQHRKAFESAVEVVRGIKNNHQLMTQRFRISELLLGYIIEALTQEETKLIMAGDELPKNKKALRDGIKDFLALSSSTILETTDLLAFGSSKTSSQGSEVGPKKIDKVQQNLEGMFTSVGEKDMITSWNRVKDLRKGLQELQDKIYAGWNESQNIKAELEKTSLAVQAKVIDLNKKIEKELARIAFRTKWFGVGAIGSTVIILIILSLIIIRRITKPVTGMTAALDRMADGDFSTTGIYQSQDEIGRMSAALTRMALAQQEKVELAQDIAAGDLSRTIRLASPGDALGAALQEMTTSLSRLLERVHEAAAQVASGSGEVASSSQALSQGATQQAAALEEITSSMTEVGAQTKTNAENATHANQLAMSARKAAEKGNDQMKVMIEAMGGINDSAREIAKIIKVIDDIAFQTNLLALNAAVEAARAGKHGKGFAVVAQEVRNLAGRSAKAARETTELIEGSIRKVEDGGKIVNMTAEALSEIVAEISKVTDLVGEIAAASNEQAGGFAQINQGLSQVDTVTQKNTSSAEQTASAAIELSGQSGRLREVLSGFKLKEQEGLAKLEPDYRAEQTPAEVTRAGSTIVPRDQAIKPSDIIALDDQEFGKY